MKRHHPAKMWLRNLRSPLCGELFLIPPRNAHFREPARAGCRQQSEICDLAYVHWSSAMSVLKPGPNAARKP